MAQNSENAAWNAKHNGKRVPINDSGQGGYPFALGSNQPNWSDGSANYAVKSYLDFVGKSFSTEDAADGAAGILDIPRLNRYIFPDLLYGRNGDARGTVIRDAMSMRGYPTGEVTIDFDKTNCSGCYRVSVDGSAADAVLGSWLNFSVQTTLKTPLPYDVVNTVVIEGIYDSAYNQYATIQLKIISGETVSSLVKVAGDVTWLASDKAWFGCNISTGNLYYTLSSVSTNEESTPTYDIIPISSILHESTGGGTPTNLIRLVNTGQSAPCEDVGVEQDYWCTSYLPSIGDTVFTDSGGTNPVYSYNWWWFSDLWDETYLIDQSGVIINVTSCPL